MVVNKNIEDQLSISTPGVSNAHHNVAVLYYLPRRVNVFSPVGQVLIGRQISYYRHELDEGVLQTDLQLGKRGEGENSLQ